MANIRPLYYSLFILLLSISITQAKAPDRDLLRTSCVHASYPKICVRSLSSSRSSATTPRELAQLAVRVTLARARKATDLLAQLTGGGGRREQGAVRDCIEQMGDSVDELRKTLAVLQHLRRDSDFRWQMSNAETWVSAALANEDTCLDGFNEIDGKLRSDVHRKITNVARVTSNALYLINALDDSHAKISSSTAAP